MVSSSGRPRERFRLGGLEIDSVTFAEAIDEIDALVSARAGGAVFTPNIDHVVNVQSSRPFREAYQAAELCLIDGKALLWAAKLLGAPLPEKISGSDLLVPLMRSRQLWQTVSIRKWSAKQFRLRRTCSCCDRGQIDGERMEIRQVCIRLTPRMPSGTWLETQTESTPCPAL